MTELLTTRQVQDLLKVDRITIYRMLNDGRLIGVKIGQQWRFHKHTVERLLGNARLISSPPPENDSGMFPTHCIQPIQNLFTQISQVGAVVVDNAGAPITEPSTPCDLCRQMLADKDGAAACRRSWSEIAAADGFGPFTCHAGLNYLRHPIHSEGQQVGWILVGHICWHAMEEAQLPGRALTEAERRDLPEWASHAGHAIEAIINERAAMLERFQAIADITKLP